MQMNALSSGILILSIAFLVSACQPSTSELPTPSSNPAATSEETEMAGGTDESLDADNMMALATTTTYESPAGPEDVMFSLIVDAEGTILEANTTVLGKAPISIMRQESFAEALPEAIKGKKLSELTSIDRVGGSSLTTGAFNEALEDLKAQM